MPNAVAASATRSSTTAVVTDDHDTHPAQVAGFRRGSWFGARLDDVVDALGQLRSPSASASRYISRRWTDANACQSAFLVSG